MCGRVDVRDVAVRLGVGVVFWGMGVVAIIVGGWKCSSSVEVLVSVGGCGEGVETVMCNGAGFLELDRGFEGEGEGEGEGKGDGESDGAGESAIPAAPTRAVCPCPCPRCCCCTEEGCTNS